MANRNFQNINVPLTGKQSDDIPKNLLQLPFLKKVENFVYKKQSSIEGRKFLKKITDIPALNDKPLKVYSYNGKLVFFGEQGVYTYDETQKKYRLLSQRRVLELNTHPLTQKERDIRFPSLALWNNDIYVFYVFNNRIFHERYNLSNKRFESVETPFSIAGIGTDEITALSVYVENKKQIWVGALTDEGIFVQPFRPGLSPEGRPFQNGSVKKAKALILEGGQAYYLLNSHPLSVTYNTADASSGDIDYVNRVFNAVDENNLITAQGFNNKPLHDFYEWTRFDYGGTSYRVVWTPHTGYFVVNSLDQILGHNYSNAVPYEVGSNRMVNLSKPVIVKGKVFYPVLKTGQLEDLGQGEVLYPLGLELVEIDFDSGYVPEIARVGDQMLVSGAVNSYFNGSQFVELGFTEKPAITKTDSDDYDKWPYGDLLLEKDLPSPTELQGEQVVEFPVSFGRSKSPYSIQSVYFNVTNSRFYKDAEASELATADELHLRYSTLINTRQVNEEYPGVLASIAYTGGALVVTFTGVSQPGAGEEHPGGIVLGGVLYEFQALRLNGGTLSCYHYGDRPANFSRGNVVECYIPRGIFLQDNLNQALTTSQDNPQFNLRQVKVSRFFRERLSLNPSVAPELSTPQVTFGVLEDRSVVGEDTTRQEPVQYSGRFTVDQRDLRGEGDPFGYGAQGTFDRDLGRGSVTNETGLVNGFLPGTKLKLSLMIYSRPYASQGRDAFTLRELWYVRLEANTSDYASLSAFQADADKITSFEIGDTNFQTVNLPNRYASNEQQLGYFKYASRVGNKYRVEIRDFYHPSRGDILFRPIDGASLNNQYWSHTGNLTSFTFKVNFPDRTVTVPGVSTEQVASEGYVKENYSARVGLTGDQEPAGSIVNAMVSSKIELTGLWNDSTNNEIGDNLYLAFSTPKTAGDGDRDTLANFKTYLEGQIDKLEFRHETNEVEFDFSILTEHRRIDTDNTLTLVYNLNTQLAGSDILKTIIGSAVEQEQISIVFTGARGERYLEVSSQIQPDIMSARYSSTSTLDKTDIRSNLIFLNPLDRSQRFSYRLTPDSFKELTVLASGGVRSFYKKTEDNPLDLDSTLFNFQKPVDSLTLQYALVDVQFNARQLLKAHVYRYRCRFKWVDHEGTEHRSGWSDRLTLLANRPMGEAGNRPSFNVSNLHLSNRARGSLTIEVYRTENRLSSYRLIKEVSNNRDEQFTVITDDVLDENLGALDTPDNILISGAKFCVEYKGRYVLYGFPEKANRIVVSSPIRNRSNNAIDFKSQGLGGDLVEILMDEPVVCVRSMDQYINIHTTSKVYTWAVNEASANQSYPVEVTGMVNIRAKDSKSAERTSQGVIFVSNKGIWTLARGLNAVFTGADVQGFDGDVKEISNLIKEEETRFLTDSDDFPVLVYNNRFKKWSVFSLKGLVSSTVWGDKWVVLNERGQLYEEAEDTENEVSYSFETGWVNFTAVKGFQRVRDFTLLADFKDLKSLRVEVSYDFNESVSEELAANLESLLERLGDTHFDKSLDVIKEFRFQQRRQKCRAMKFKFKIRAKKAEVSSVSFNVRALMSKYIRSSQVS